MSITLISLDFASFYNKINGHLLRENTQTLSILDFAGFERFQHNTLDQLCINVANEKLHWFFCHHIFSMEQRDLEAQGVKAELVEFKDNQNLIDLFFQVGKIFMWYIKRPIRDKHVRYALLLHVYNTQGF